MQQLGCLLILFLQASLLNALDLQADSSRLSFVTIKNDAIAEVMSFSGLSGNIDPKSGAAHIDVDLNSVVSGIEIRDTRLREQLFETKRFPMASFSTSVDMKSLGQLQIGEQLTTSLNGQLSLHGVVAPLKFDVVISKLSSGAFHAATLSPGLIDTKRFELVAGVGKLRSIAGLASIGLTVPVTFSVVFQ
jgi:polyisoprenoid-binding protein YceI